MVVIFVKYNENTYPKWRAIVTQTKRRNK